MKRDFPRQGWDAVPAPQAAATRFMMVITVDAEAMTALRRIVIATFGDMIGFIRIQTVNHATRIKVCLCLMAPIANRVMETVMQSLPDAEFGQICPV
jgi:hypothetical protein